MIEKPKLFLNVKQFWFSMIFLILILLFRIFFLYEEYQLFRDKPLYFTEVKVLQAYEKTKNKRNYTVLKLYSPDLNLNFFTITSIPSKEIHQRLRMKLFPNYKMRFQDYLSTSFISSNVNEVYKEEESLKGKILNFIEKQHLNPMIANFYSAIYLAQPVEKELRESISKLGISHLIALSGFHLALLSSMLFFFLRPLYRVFQQRYFPYRFDVIDIGFSVLVLLGWYVWFVDAPASLIRSYMMLLSGWTLLLLGVELLTLSFLTTIVLILLILFPYLLFSLAFWLSIIGVFYIFLLLQYFSDLPKVVVTFIISFGLFLLMQPIVHLIFPLTTPYQLLSPFLSLLFSIFYPLSIFLHLFGVGDLLDTLLMQLFAMKSIQESISLPIMGTALYLLLSLGAFFFKKLFYLLLGISLLFFFYFFKGFLL